MGKEERIKNLERAIELVPSFISKDHIDFDFYAKKVLQWKEELCTLREEMDMNKREKGNTNGKS